MAGEVQVIYVDLDRTLLRIDLLSERLLVAILRRPAILFLALFWLIQGGRPRLKTELARQFPLDVAYLPYNEELIQLLKEKRKAGVELVLATASPEAWARAVADELALFDRVLATTETSGNLKGKTKLAAIRKDAGERSFGYAGDSGADRCILEDCTLPIVVGSSTSLAGSKASQAILISPRSPEAQAWWKAFRPHQWSKNVLIFAPALAAHEIGLLWPNGLLAFVIFCIVASAFYLLNDFCDIDLDRRHPEKQWRAQACGALPSSVALVIALVLIVAAAGLSNFLPSQYGIIVLSYGIISAIYSVEIKNVPVLDLITLAFLYSLRVFAGGTACHVYISTWLFAFVFFIALSLSHLKRYVELTQRKKSGLGPGARPAYIIEDIPMMMSVGLCSGLLSVLVLALYINSPQTDHIYRHPALLILVCVFLMYWIQRMWFWAGRDRISGDPIVFIVTDHISYLVGAACLITMWVATVY